MKIKKFVGGVLYQYGESETSYYWIKDSGEVISIVANKFDKYAAKDVIPDIVWLAIKVGAYETISKLPR